MDSLQLISRKNDFIFFFIILFSMFTINLVYEYLLFQELSSEEIYESKFQIENIYDKNEYIIVKVSNNKFSFFTSINKDEKVEKLQNIRIAFLTKNIDFVSYLKGFYSKSIYYELFPKKNSIKTFLNNYISEQHSSIKLKELFNALFLAIPISKENRAIYNNFGISHLITTSRNPIGL